MLGYAIWAETHPDSIKSVWLESKNQPEELIPDFDAYEVRIIVVAPSFEATVAQHMLKINYEVDLVEVNRYQVKNEEFILVNRLEPAAPIKHKTAQGAGVYDLEFFERNYDKESVAKFFGFVESTKRLSEDMGWPLDFKMNKSYAIFKIGTSQCFGIEWMSSKTFKFFFKLSESEARAASPAGVQITKYSTQWKQSEFKVEPRNLTAEEYMPLMKASVEKLVSK